MLSSRLPAACLTTFRKHIFDLLLLHCCHSRSVQSNAFPAAQVAGEEQRSKLFQELLPALLNLDSGAGRDWRMQHHLMLALPDFVNIFTSDQVGSS